MCLLYLLETTDQNSTSGTIKTMLFVYCYWEQISTSLNNEERTNKQTGIVAKQKSVLQFPFTCFCD